MQRFRLVAFAIAIGFSTLTGCFDERLGMRTFTHEGSPPTPSVVIFFVDGLDHTRFNALLDDGKLPNIQRQFVEGGVGVKNAVTSIPSVTYPNAVSLMTGCFPGHHGVLGNQWFDRNEFFLRDYSSALTYQTVNTDFKNPTLFEVLDDKLTVNVRCHTRRGVTKSFDHALGTGIDWILTRFHHADERVGLTAPMVAKYAQESGRWPSIYLSYFPGVDATGHLRGSDSEAYEKGLIVADQAIGRITATVEKNHPGAPNYFILVTDHSHVPAHRDQFADIYTWLKKSTGLRVHRGANEGSIPSWRQSHFDRCDAVFINGAYRRVTIHFKSDDGWSQRASTDNVEQIIRPDETGLCGGLPGIALAGLRDGDDKVRVLSDHHTFEIERREFLETKRYRINEITPEDSSIASSRRVGRAHHAADASDQQRAQPTTQPHNDTDQPARLAQLLREWSDGQWRSSREWLTKTAGSELPDFVPQIVEFFDSERAGDVILFADGEWSFHKAEEGGHGSCLAVDMRIPMFFAGPGISKGTNISAARLVDVMPTALDMLGELKRLEARPPIDGISVLPQLRAATTRP
ncbi:MAG: hypothetical protein DHS20C16_13290 [Phycisphaerae bacterium]|nr:MAG: hypothetical protein DHS20C16_13290 [Phycisphaerae bacterium]